MNKCYLEGYEDGFVMGYSVGAAHGRGAYHPYEEEADAIMSKARATRKASDWGDSKALNRLAGRVTTRVTRTAGLSVGRK